MNDPKEFTQDEFDRFVEKNNLEVFTKAQVDAFSKDVVEKSKNKEIDEFEIACCTADYISLKPVFVRRNDLMKSLMFYREAQREPVEIPDGIFKSIDDRMCFRYKETPLNILKGIAGINCADDVAIEKAKALPLGTEKMYGGKMYVKTEKGWRPKKKGAASTSKEEKVETKESKKESEKASATTYKERKKEVISSYEKDLEDVKGELEKHKCLEYRVTSNWEVPIISIGLKKSSFDREKDKYVDFSEEELNSAKKAVEEVFKKKGYDVDYEDSEFSPNFSIDKKEYSKELNESYNREKAEAKAKRSQQVLSSSKETEAKSNKALGEQWDISLQEDGSVLARPKSGTQASKDWGNAFKLDEVKARLKKEGLVATANYNSDTLRIKPSKSKKSTSQTSDSTEGSSAKDIVKQIAKEQKLPFKELWNAVKEDYSDGGIDSLSKRDVYEIIDASGISPKKANKKEASNEKSVKQKTQSFLGDYDRALMENFRLKKELFNAEEQSKYRSGNDSFYLPLEKLKKTEWYENQLNKIKESENKLSKIKAEKPEELDKEALNSELKIMKDGQDWFENRVKTFREKGYDKSDDEKERNLWREATDDIKRREIYTHFVQSLIKD